MDMDVVADPPKVLTSDGQPLAVGYSAASGIGYSAPVTTYSTFSY